MRLLNQSDMNRMIQACILATLSLAAFGAAAQTVPDFTQISALFAERCVICHNGPGAPLGLQLDSYTGVMKGSQKGPVVRSGNPDGSELIRRLRGISQPRMPLTGPPFLSDSQIAGIAAWVQAGARPASKQETVAVVASPRLPAAGERVTYADVQPILLQRCVKCHQDNGLMGRPPEGLRLQTLPQLLTGGERAVVVPGSPLASELVRRIRGLSRPRMPFDGPPYLSDDEIRVISDWVTQGALDAQEHKAPIPVGARVRLHGHLTGRWALDGLPLDVNSGTRIKKRVGVGSYVRIRGIVGRNGRIQVSRIQAR